MTLHFCNKTRHIILFLAILGLTLMMSNTLVFNFTNICMTKKKFTKMGEFSRSNSTTLEPDSKSNSSAEAIFNNDETNIILSGTYYGCLFGAIPVTYLTNKYGTRIMFTSYGLLGAVSTAITPLLFDFGLWMMFGLRIFQGIPIAATFVSMASITMEWSPVYSTGFFLSWMSCNIQFGAMFTMPVAGYLCESRFEWPSVYYLHGTISIIVFIIFFMFFRDTPREHRNVSAKELVVIERGKMKEPADRSVPYAKMLCDRIIWTILLACFTGLFAIYLFVQYGPNYLKGTLKIDTKETGLVSAFPYALSCSLKMIAGPISDSCVCLSEKARVILFASVSQFFMAACYIALAFVPLDWIFAIKICYTLIITFSGLNVVGVLKSAQEVSRYFSHVIMAWIVVITGIIGCAVLPIAKRLFVPTGTNEEWNRLFLFTAALIIFGNTVFVFTIDVRPRNWAVETAAPAFDTLPTPEALTPKSNTEKASSRNKDSQKMSP